MKVALIQPPVEDFYQTSIRTQPVGLLYLAGMLESAGHHVKIFDFLSWREKHAAPCPDAMSYLKAHFLLRDQSPLRAFKHYYHFGCRWQEVESILSGADFDAYGVSCMFTPFFSQSNHVAAIIRRHHPGKPIAAGGTHATAVPHRVLGQGNFDVVFQGEGEYSFLKWIASTTDRSSLRQGAVCAGQAIQNLDELPFPARHLIDLDRYRINGVRSTMLITSRGCPYRCTFCSVQQTMGHAFRVRSVENVVREIEECLERYDIRHFDIEDDNFTFDQARAEEIMTAVLDRFGEATLRFSAMNGLTASHLRPSLLKRMKQAGFSQINLSLVTSQPDKIRELKRPVSFAGFRRTVRATREAQLECISYFILGLPGDDRSRMLETLFALAAEPVLVGPSVFYVSPGTELFDELAAYVPENWDLLRSSTFFMETGASTRLERITVFRLTRLVNFLKERLDRGDWESELRHTLTLLQNDFSVQAAGQSQINSSTMAGWAVAVLLYTTGKFHAACRPNRHARTYRFEPLPTCERTVELFWKMAPQAELAGIRTSARVMLSDVMRLLALKKHSSPQRYGEVPTKVDHVNVDV
ncbi:MAG TPA: radical SAM protein [Acidobacteriota bacterium]